MERAPWGNMYEFSTTLGLVAVGAYLGLLALGRNVRWIGLFLVTAVLLDLGLAVTVLYTDDRAEIAGFGRWFDGSAMLLVGLALPIGMIWQYRAWRDAGRSDAAGSIRLRDHGNRVHAAERRRCSTRSRD